MRTTIICLLLISGLMACKEQKATQPSETAEATAPPAQKDRLTLLAERHGFDHWKGVEEIRFTFNVDRGENHFERSWRWKPAEGEVTRISGTDTVTYARAAVDSALTEVDAAFINDKYWLLAPYQWVWDRNSLTHSFEEDVPAPISGTPSDKLTIVYGNEGGYTPGDAYDFYFEADSLVSEWVFRKGNQADPSLITTWEGYEDVGGLQLSTRHQNEDGGFQLYFTDISIR